MKAEDVVLDDSGELNGALAHLGRNDVDVF